MSVVPIPTNDVEAIPMACVVPDPAFEYTSSSQDTKKWPGILIVSSETFTVDELLPSKFLSKIGSWLLVRLNCLFTSVNVPVYVPCEVSIDPLIRSIGVSETVESKTFKVFWKTTQGRPQLADYSERISRDRLP